MWNEIVSMIVTSVETAFSWFTAILNTDDSIWPSAIYVISCLLACRFLLAPFLGFSWASSIGRSDGVRKNVGGKNE